MTGLRQFFLLSVLRRRLDHVKPSWPRYANASDAQICQRIDRLAHQESYVRVRSFEFSHRVIESLTQTRVVMALNLVSFEEPLISSASVCSNSRCCKSRA